MIERRNRARYSTAAEEMWAEIDYEPERDFRGRAIDYEASEHAIHEAQARTAHSRERQRTLILTKNIKEILIKRGKMSPNDPNKVAERMALALREVLGEEELDTRTFEHIIGQMGEVIKTTIDGNPMLSRNKQQFNQFVIEVTQNVLQTNGVIE